MLTITSAETVPHLRNALSCCKEVRITLEGAADNRITDTRGNTWKRQADGRYMAIIPDDQEVESGTSLAIAE
ncbi:hypothetical protein Dcar01_02419 [Deinococcus carri]|uniref:Uncharacterized protein n=1 Tax=Deinococcus carri TaxID=1211323 RepID=A0ABP9W8J7_9DEIO